MSLMVKKINPCTNCANYKPVKKEEETCNYCSTYPAEYLLDGEPICEECWKAKLKIHLKSILSQVDDMRFLSLKEISKMLGYEIEVL